MDTLRKVGIVGTVTLALLLSGVAFAEDNPLKALSETEKENLQSAREEAKQKIEAAREESKKKIESAREEAKMRMEIAREEAKAKMEAQREKARQKLSEIKDKEKQQKAERVADQFDNLNKKWTGHFTQQLDKLGNVLIKIQERADIAARNGKDIAAVSIAIQSSKTAIEVAQVAVSAQAAKTYVLSSSSITTASSVTTSSGQNELINALKTQFQGMHKAIFKDLYALRDGVMKDARKSVQDALQILGQIPKVDEDSDGSSAESN
jgi:hypothetical protein